MPGQSTAEAVFDNQFRKYIDEIIFDFIDLEKAYDMVLRELIWEVFNYKILSHCYIDIINDMYQGTATNILSASGILS